MDDSPADPDQRYCLDLVQKHAADLYLSDLLLPEAVLHDIAVVHAFHVELTHIALAMAEPMAAQIRLQWWSDVVEGQRAEEAQGNPVARALLKVMERHSLPGTGFAAKAQAHVFDLYNDPMGDWATFEGYCGETRSCLFQWAVLIAAPERAKQAAEASGHAGVAAAIVNILENMAHLHDHGRVHLPSDLLEAVGLYGGSFLETPDERHQQCITGLVDMGFEHYAKAIAALDAMAQLETGQKVDPVRMVFKPIAPVPLYLKSVHKAPLKVFGTRRRVSQFRKQWAIWRF